MSRLTESSASSSLGQSHSASVGSVCAEIISLLCSHQTTASSQINSLTLSSE